MKYEITISSYILGDVYVTTMTQSSFIFVTTN